MMKGIDIGSSQGTNIDFAKIKAQGIEIVYIKATEGITYNSATMLAQYKGAKAQGLKVGFYHYLRNNSPIAEADHFIAVTKGLPVDCLYGIDVEIPLGQSGAKISLNVKQFSDHMISKGLKTCIYTGDAFYSAYLNESVRDICSWIAHYGVVKPDAVGYAGFQYSETGRLNGINGDVDLDTFSSAILISGSGISTQLSLLEKAKSYVGARCLELQKGLITLGYKLTPDIADGIFGQGTLTNLITFQKAHSLSQDGLAGTNVFIELNVLLAKKPVIVKPVIPVQPKIISKELLNYMFSENWYLSQNADVKKAVADKMFANGLAHYIAYGKKELRQPCPPLPLDFNEGVYLASNIDVANAVAKKDFCCGVEHYLLYGFAENRKYK